MKQRSDFKSTDQYIEYLRIYFAGQAIMGLVCMDCSHSFRAEQKTALAVVIAESLINNLNLKHE